MQIWCNDEVWVQRDTIVRWLPALRWKLLREWSNNPLDIMQLVENNILEPGYDLGHSHFPEQAIWRRFVQWPFPTGIQCPWDYESYSFIHSGVRRIPIDIAAFVAGVRNKRTGCVNCLRSPYCMSPWWVNANNTSRKLISSNYCAVRCLFSTQVLLLGISLWMLCPSRN